MLPFLITLYYLLVYTHSLPWVKMDWHNVFHNSELTPHRRKLTPYLCLGCVNFKMQKLLATTTAFVTLAVPWQPAVYCSNVHARERNSAKRDHTPKIATTSASVHLSSDITGSKIMWTLGCWSGTWYKLLPIRRWLCSNEQKQLVRWRLVGTAKAPKLQLLFESTAHNVQQAEASLDSMVPCFACKNPLVLFPFTQHFCKQSSGVKFLVARATS